MSDQDPTTRAAADTVRERVAAVEKAALDWAKGYKARLDDEHARRQQSVNVYPQLTFGPEVMPAVNLAGTDMEPVAKAIKELGQYLAEQPLPVVQAPQPTVVTVPPSEVIVDMSQLEKLVGDLLQDRVESRLLLEDLRETVGRTNLVNEALLNVLTTLTNRKPRTLEVEQDDRGNVVRITEQR